MGKELLSGKRVFPVGRELRNGNWEESFPAGREPLSGKRTFQWESSFLTWEESFP